MIELKLTPREQQLECLSFFQKSVANNKKFIMLDAPVGSGKSYLPSLLGKWYQEEVNPESSIDVITHTKSLQRQYVDDFDYIVNLYGQSNYTCHHSSEMSCDEGKLQNDAQRHCPECPYKKNFNQFIEADVGLCNFQLFNSYKVYVPHVYENRNSRLLFIDEAHLFEENFADFISNTVSERLLKSFRISNQNCFNRLSTITSVGAAYEYISDTLMPEIVRLKGISKAVIENTHGQEKIDAAKHWALLDNHQCKYNRFLDNYGDNNWVLNISEGKRGDVSYNIEPVWGKNYMEEYIWSTYDHIVLMSGTILDRGIFSFLHGVDESNTAYLSLGNDFPSENRPIFYLPSGKLTYKELRYSIPEHIKTLKKILHRHRNQKGIIHCGTYEVSRMLENALKDFPNVIFHEPQDREAALQEHINSVKPTVLFSPVMYTGIDLKDDLSRFQVIMKIQYPYLGSEKVKKRLAGYRNWYAWKTINEIIQSYGRSIRSRDDWAFTYILDSSFGEIYKRNARMFPNYVVDGLSAGANFTKKSK